MAQQQEDFSSRREADQGEGLESTLELRRMSGESRQ